MKPLRTSKFVVGDRVKPSYYALTPRLEDRSKWMKWSSQWASADVVYQRAAARRGTVTETPESKYGAGCTVQWDDGGVSKCLDYMVELDSAPVSK